EKLPDSLKRFSPGTQKRIVQWYKTARKTARKNNNDVDEDFEDDDIDQMLLVIEWDEDGIRTRNVPKQQVIDVIQAFDGCANQFGILGVAPSETIFSITDTRNHCKGQIVEDTLAVLRELYYQRHQPSLGDVFEIKATRRGVFNIVNRHHVF
ncbi:9989_t:CDS:2, partial [Paraglomus brasilianum]